MLMELVSNAATALHVAMPPLQSILPSTQEIVVPNCDALAANYIRRWEELKQGLNVLGMSTLAGGGLVAASWLGKKISGAAGYWTHHLGSSADDGHVLKGAFRDNGMVEGLFNHDGPQEIWHSSQASKELPANTTIIHDESYFSSDRSWFRGTPKKSYREIFSKTDFLASFLPILSGPATYLVTGDWGQALAVETGAVILAASLPTMVANHFRSSAERGGNPSKN